MWITVSLSLLSEVVLVYSTIVVSSASRDKTLECFPRAARITARIILVSSASVPGFQGHTGLESCFILMLHSGMLWHMQICAWKLYPRWKFQPSTGWNFEGYFKDLSRLEIFFWYNLICLFYLNHSVFVNNTLSIIYIQARRNNGIVYPAKLSLMREVQWRLNT